MNKEEGSSPMDDHPIRTLALCLQGLYNTYWEAASGYDEDVFAMPLINLGKDVSKLDCNSIRYFLEVLCTFLEENEDGIFDKLQRLSDGPGWFARFLGKATYMEECLILESKKITLEDLFRDLAHEDLVYIRCAHRKVFGRNFFEELPALISRPDLCKKLKRSSAILNNSWFKKGFPKPTNPGEQPQLFRICEVNAWLKEQGREEIS